MQAISVFRMSAKLVIAGFCLGGPTMPWFNVKRNTWRRSWRSWIMVPRSPAGRGISSRLKKQEIVTSTRLGSRKKMPLTFATTSRRHQTGASASRRFATCWRCKFHICIHLHRQRWLTISYNDWHKFAAFCCLASACILDIRSFCKFACTHS